MGVMALLLPKTREWQAAQILDELEITPLKSIVTVTEKSITSTRHTFSVGTYGVTDVGNLRLAFADLSFPGTSSGGVTLATDSTSSGASGHTGIDNRRWEEEGIPHGSRCKFGGVTFEIVDGKLSFGGESIDAMGQPTLVLIGTNREILELKPVSYTHLTLPTNREV